MKNKSSSGITSKFVRYTIYNFSLYNLSSDENIALSHRLNQHMPTKLTKYAIKTEFKIFYQGLLSGIPHILEQNIFAIKTKMLKSFKSYCNVCESHR